MSKPYMIPEIVDPRRRLGRHLNHDPQSLRYAIRPVSSAHATTTRKRIIPILDQGNTGSCTGNAKLGALGSEGLWEACQPVFKIKGWTPDEAFARDNLYHLATVLDSYPGTYPGQDTGSDGLSVSKAAQQDGLNNGYTHALSLDAMITGLQDVAGIMGINWYDSFDDPGEGAVLELPATAKVRGGHEIHILNVDMEREWLEACQSWGLDWGIKGHFYVPFTVAERLLSEDGDATFDVPLTVAPPVPTPTPADPMQAIMDFYGVAGHWSTTSHRGCNKKAANGARTMFEAVGLTPQ